MPPETASASLETRLVSLLRSCLPPSAAQAELRPDSSLRGELGMDSVQLLLLLFRFEEEFGVELPGAALPNGAMTTVGELLEHARRVLAEAGRG
jgi:acyl carrier protein